ncbi:MAG: amino acid permease, partial [Acidobacteriota bacterium]|nr:amino acid permease [Acidobacteriota bacterium]
RVAEDGVLPDWFRHPHHKFGTTNRMINLIVILQLITILISRGDVYMLGEAYAFGVVWSFAMKGLSVLVLRYKLPEAREWKVPLNFRIGKTEIPVGLALITLMLFMLALVNVMTKKVATISGITFTLAFFLVFELSERANRHRHTKGHHTELEKFLLDSHPEVTPDTVRVRPANVLVAIRNPKRLAHLERILAKTDTRKMDIVVLSVRLLNPKAGDTLEVDQIFSQAEQQLFSSVVTLAEKAGKHVELMVVPGTDPIRTVVQTAARLRSSRIVMGLSPRYTPSEQGQVVGQSWEELPAPRPSISLELVSDDAKDPMFFNLGPHPPRLWPEDIDLVHRLWLDLSAQGPGAALHHRDVVGVALRRLQRDLQAGRSPDVLAEARDEAARPHSEG